MSNTNIPQAVHTALNWMDRPKLVEILEGISIQCYDHESDQVLRDAIVQNIDDGTLDVSDVVEDESGSGKRESHPFLRQSR